MPESQDAAAARVVDAHNVRPANDIKTQRRSQQAQYGERGSGDDGNLYAA